MLMKFFAVVSFSPIFAVPGFFVSVLGGWCGQIYMKAQLSVKREMSNARAPVLGYFGAAIAGLSTCRMSPIQLSADFDTCSLDPRIRRSGPVQEGVVPQDRPLRARGAYLLEPQPLGVRPYRGPRSAVRGVSRGVPRLRQQRSCSQHRILVKHGRYVSPVLFRFRAL